MASKDPFDFTGMDREASLRAALERATRFQGLHLGNLWDHLSAHWASLDNDKGASPSAEVRNRCARLQEAVEAWKDAETLRALAYRTEARARGVCSAALAEDTREAA